MQKCLTRCFLLFFLSLTCSSSDPVVIQTLKNGEQYEGHNNFGVSTNQGIANFEGDAGFNKLNEKNLVNSMSNVRYGEQNNNKNDHLSANNFNTGNFFNKGGTADNSFEDKKVHQKGHQRNGFHNSYHKDEVGSNSSFYDSGSDEGGQHIRKSDSGSYGNAMEDNKHGNHLDSSYHANQGVNQGQYDNAHIYDADRMNNQNYNRNHQFDDRRISNQGANSFGAGGIYDEQRYASPPYRRDHYVGGDGYYEGYDRSYPKRRITIFEDPRYDEHPNQMRYNHDRIELDVRPARRHPDYFHRRRHGYY
ncbi:uncharacterized protein DDB_G0283357-like [Diorhabda carinulata]|uniref:uncharacterized protein DDB_G0283357-like n=1 Tax=Diorhabda carinulata TaxID=1163345 RepID=UPI0025A03525|nr:uncharacterized protein DDB_G0283357-like [Diorhabda carinulata]